jgi:glycosyltransferase involved in cell wall biosynthesis
LIRQFFYLLFHWGKFDYHVAFFAGYHSALPALFAKWSGKKSYIFLGGTDCFRYPSFRYGNFTKTWYGAFTCFSASKASLLIPVSHNLVDSESNYYKEDFTKQGIYHWCEDLHTPHQVIPLEYNPSMFHRLDVERKENSFISVAFGIEGTSFVRKGIDKIVMLAKNFPQYHFTIIGTSKEKFPVSVPENLDLIPPVPYEDLPKYYSAHQFYLQLSIAEGFPSAICEAMLCECIPIGSDVAAIPEIMGANGFLVKERIDKVIMQEVEKAVAFSDKNILGKKSRQHIVDHFGPGARIHKLMALFAPVERSGKSV